MRGVDRIGDVVWNAEEIAVVWNAEEIDEGGVRRGFLDRGIGSRGRNDARDEFLENRHQNARVNRGESGTESGRG